MRGDQDLNDAGRVAAVLRDLNDAANRWADVLAETDGTTFTVDVGDIRAVADVDGRLVGLELHPGVTTHYSHGELALRLNGVFAALRAEAEANFAALARMLSPCP